MQQPCSGPACPITATSRIYPSGAQDLYYTIIIAHVSSYSPYFYQLRITTNLTL